MFKIGDFSRLCRVPVSALRYYADLGLLPPVHVDAFTGYRYYTTEQLPRLYRILALRDLGLSLEQISRVLDEGLTAEQIRGMLRLRQVELRQHIDQEQERLARVEARLHQMEQEGSMSSYDVLLKEIPAQLVASVRDIAPTYKEVGPLFGELYSYLGRHGGGGISGCIWHDETYKERDVDTEVVAYIQAPVPPGERVKVYELPAATVASTVHRGAFSGFPAAYEAATRWIEANGYQIVGPIREVYLNMGADDGPDSPNNLTEIQIPVAHV